MPSNRLDRRTFLGTTLGASASVVLLRSDAGFSTRLKWCSGPVFPLAKKQVSIERGTLPSGTEARLELRLYGPGMEQGYCVSTDTAYLKDALTVCDIRLGYNHPSVVPGEYRYQLSMYVGGTRLEAPSIQYTINPFSFGV